MVEYSQMKPKIKILIAYHKPSSLLKSEIFEPIFVGSELKNDDWLLNNAVADNKGNNISNKNESFCELTAQYWAWKNCDCDYIGFMHYRRHLNFSEKEYNENIYGLIENEQLDGYYIKKYGLTYFNVEKALEDADILTAKRWNVQNAGSKDTYDHYKNSDKKLHIKDYDLALEILKNKYPQYCEDIEIYNKEYLGYFTNMFVMKKEQFNQYCSWLFDILFELEKRIDITNYTTEEKRVFGYISEWLFGIYMTHIKRTTNLKIKELQRTFIKNCDIIQDNDAINVCFSTDNNYIQHLGVAIASILKNTKTKKKIDFYILNDGSLLNKNKKKLKTLENLKENVKINFLSIDGENFKEFYLLKDSHFSYATYYRYSIPSLLNKISKIIYLDCDLIFQDDIEKLYETPLEDNYIAAVKDILQKENRLRLNLNDYFNAGVLLIDLDKLRKNNIEKILIETTKKYDNKLRWQDQDVINIVFENRIKPLELCWNFQYFYDDLESDFDFEELRFVKKNPKIIHFVGHVKPWDTYSLRPNAEKYFKYLKYTPWKNFCYVHIIKSFFKSLLDKKNTNKYVIISILGFRFKKVRKLQLLRNDIKNLQKEIWRIDKEKRDLIEFQNKANTAVFNLYLDNIAYKRQNENFELEKYLKNITQPPEYLFVDSSHNYLNILLNQKEFYYKRKFNPDKTFLHWELARWDAGLDKTNYSINHNKDILFVGDSFLRSVYPQCKTGVDEKYKKGISFCIDDLGWYYDSARINRLEKMLNDKNLILSPEQIQRARDCIDKIVKNHLTKYNHQPIYVPDIGKNKKKILVVDQTTGDMSIIKGSADENTFSNMLDCALLENPDCDILVKTHPDTLIKGGGYYRNIESKDNIYIVKDAINPISLIQYVDEIYVCTSQFGFEALMCNKPVHCFGAPFYSNWGLTDDRIKIERRTNKRTLEEIFYITYIMYSRYVNPDKNKPCEIEEAMDYLIKLRDEII